MVDTQEKGARGRVRWLRIIAGAVAVEAALLAVAIPLNMSEHGRAILLPLVIPLCVIATFLGSWWVTRGAGGLFLLHGLLVGAAAAIIYGGLTWKVTLPAPYIVANCLKLLAGAGGGLMVQAMRRRQRAMLD